mmetsp:Transcript_13044/g.33147  ORF Transcript_13044/g.33147 Transcript_13044/m.33147 type:complete len:291 (+) Transcript_13044:582-1454(+)
MNDGHRRATSVLPLPPPPLPPSPPAARTISGGRGRVGALSDLALSDLLLHEGGGGVVDDVLEKADDGEDAADYGARGGDEPVEGDRLLRDDNGDGREVVTKLDGGLLVLGRRELVGVHRVLVGHGVVRRVVMLEQLGHHLEVVDVRVPRVLGDKGESLEAVARSAKQLRMIGSRQPPQLRAREGLSEPKVVDEVGGVDEVRLVVVLLRMNHQPERARHLAHLQVAGDLAALGTMQQRARCRDHLGGVGHLDVTRPCGVVVEVLVGGVRCEARLEVDHRQLGAGLGRLLRL